MSWRGLAAMVALIALAAGAGAQDGAGPRTGVPWLARVNYVVDGDSVWVRPEDGGRRVRLRIEGVDAPEICQPFGAQARAALQALALNQRVRVTVHARDRYGRAIASMVRLPDELNLAEQMVVQGWAWTDGFRWRRGLYWRAEAEARDARRGLFAGPRPEPPSEFRTRHGPCDTGGVSTNGRDAKPS